MEHNRKNKCILCNELGTYISYNNIDMYECRQCDLRWRAYFDVDITHYENKHVDSSTMKFERRLRNSYDRINTFQKYVSLNNTCDIGCGEGVFIKALQDYGFKNITGIEPNKKLEPLVDVDNLNIYTGTVEESNVIIDYSGFGVVTLFHVIEHLHNPLETIKALHNYMRKGGFLILETPDFHCYSFVKSAYRHKLIYDEHLYYFSQKSLVILLELTGFKVVAKGRRDFDIYHAPISELLSRLGFKKKKSLISEKMDAGSIDCDISSKNKSKTKLAFYSILRYVLVKIVLILKREDYLWVIATK